MLTFHSGNGGNHNGLGTFLSALGSSKWPVCIKSVDDYGKCLEAINRGGYAVFRFSTKGKGAEVGYDFDVPNYSLAPWTAAQIHWQRIKENLPPEFDPDRTWIEPINEVDKNLSVWIGSFALELAARANADGYSVLMPAWASGEPEPEAWVDMHEYLVHCAAYPRKMGVALHEYDLGIDGFDTAYPWHMGRFQWMFDYCDRNDIARPTTFITEWGWSMDNIGNLNAAIEQIDRATQFYGRFEEIQMLAIWALQDYNGKPVTGAQQLMVALTDWVLANDPPVPVPDAPLDPAYFEQPSSGTLQERLWDFGMDLKAFDTNADSAIQDRMALDGFFPSGEERWESWPEGQFAVRPAYHPLLDEDRVYYAKVGDWDNVAWIDGPGEPIEIIDVVNQLPVNTDSQWYPYNTREELTIDTVVVHHSASSPTVSVEAIARYHTSTRGWPGIAYHFCIEADGTIKQTQYVDTVSFHAGNANAYSIGICLIGNFTDAAPPAPQLDALIALVSYLSEPLMITDVIPHREVSQTSCPGETWESWWPFAFPDPPPPVGKPVDLVEYMLPNRGGYGPLFEMRRADGSQARHQTQAGPGGVFYITKGTGGIDGKSEWEELAYDDQYIWRGVDTSPGNGRYYVQYEPGQDMARWTKRYMSVGETWSGAGHQVQFYWKSNCLESSENSGPARNEITLVDANEDRITLSNGTESWVFTKGLGMTGWSSPWGSSEVSEIHTPGSRPDNVRETIPCMQ